MLRLIDSGRFLLTLSCEHDEQLLERDELDFGEFGLETSTGAVLVKDVEDAVVVIDSTDAQELRTGFSKMKREDIPAEIGVMTFGDICLRKSRYAAGGVMGVFWSSCLMNVGVPTHGLRRFWEGNDADSGVFSDDSWGFVAAMIDCEKLLAMAAASEKICCMYTEAGRVPWTQE